jgi:hypothetical protein
MGVKVLPCTWALLWPLLVTALVVAAVIRSNWCMPPGWSHWPNPVRY